MAEDPSPQPSVAALLSSLQALLLCGDEDDAEDDTPIHLTPQQLLQQLLQAFQRDPEAAASVTANANAYPLLLSSLQQGYPEAAQLLMLLLLLPVSDGWPPMVCNRLAALAGASAQDNGAGRHVAVMATRLLAAAAAAPSTITSAQLHGLLQQLQQQSAGDCDDTAASWPFTLGPGGVAAAAQLVTSLALAHNVNRRPRELHTGPDAAVPSQADDDAASDTAAAPAPAVTPASAMLMLLRLFDGLQQHTPTRLQHTASSAGALLAGSQTSPELALQLQMLTEVGDRQLAHQLPALLAKAASAAAPTAAAVGIGSPAASAAAACCCVAGWEVLRCMTVLLLTDPTGETASSPAVIQGVLSLLRGLVVSSPKATTQQLDWSGRATGFGLASTPAATCKPQSSAAPNRTGPATAAALSMLLQQHAGSAGNAAGSPASGQLPQLLPAWHAPSVAATYSAWLSSWGLAQQPMTTLEAALLLLLALCQAGSWSAAGALYASDASSVLEQLCGFVGPPSLQAVLQKVYRCLCVYSGQLRDEVLQDARILALQGLITTQPASAAGPSAAAVPTTAATSAASILTPPPAVPLRLQAAAMSRLSSALYAASGADFLAFVGAASPGSSSCLLPQRAPSPRSSSSKGSAAGGSTCGLASVVGLLLTHMSAGAGALTDAAAAGAAQDAASAAAGGGGDASKQQSKLTAALLTDARQVFLACLNRARQMQHLSATAQQLPRGGFWSNIDKTLLRCLEAWCLDPEAAASGSNQQGAAAAHGSSSGHEAGTGAAGASTTSGSSSSTSGGAAAGALAGSASSRRQAAGLPPRGGRRRAGGSASVAAAASLASGPGSAAAALRPVPASQTADGVDADSYDEDGLSEVWSSGPSAATLAVRAAWKQLSLSDAVSWTQSSNDVEIKLLLPAGTRKQDVVVSIQPDRLTVRLSWHGRVLDGPLSKRVKAGEACWSLDDNTQVDVAALKAAAAATKKAAAAVGGLTAAAPAAPAGGSSSSTSSASGGAVRMTELLVILPKEEGGRYWRALFEGGEEKSHMQVLQEALTNEDDARHAPTVDQLGPEAALLLEELRERQELIVSGQWSIEHSFDDFRLVLGDNTM